MPAVTRAALLGLLAVLVACASPAAAQDTLPPGDAAPAALLPPIVDDLNGLFQISPDGRTVVYVREAPYAVPGTLFSVPVDGSAPPRLLLASSDGSLQITAVSNEYALVTVWNLRSQRVVLQSVPLDGSGPPLMLLNNMRGSPEGTRLTAGGRAILRTWLNEGDRARAQIWSLPLDGSDPPVALSPLSVPGTAFAWALAPGGETVVYLSQASAAEPTMLFAVPAVGPATARRLLSAEGHNVGSFALSADGRVVGYSSDKRLYIVPLDGSAPARAVSPPLSSENWLSSFVLSADGGTVAFVVIGPEGEDFAFAYAHVFTAPSDGSAPAVRVSREPIEVFVMYGGYVDQQFSPDARTLAYRDGRSGALFVAGVGVAESGREVSGVGTGNVRFLDNQRLLVAGLDLAVIPLDAAVAPTLLTSREFGSVQDVLVVGERVLFKGCERPCGAGGGVTLFSVPLAGPHTAAVRLATVYRDAFFFPVAPAAEGRVVYSADSDDRPGKELYSVPIAPIGVGFAGYSLVADEGASVNLDVSLDQPADEAVSVDYRIDGLGPGQRGVLSFAPGVLSQTISLQLPADQRFSGDYSVRVTLRETQGAAPLLRHQLALIVRDDEVVQRTRLPFLARGFR